jgi:hypothetical protein
VNLSGGDGNDVFITGAAGDTFDGGNGTDAIDYQQAAAGVTVTLGTSGSAGTGAGGDSFTNVENAYGSSFADTITGNELANELRGRDGNDSLSGSAGNDTLTGGVGADSLTGGSGNDTFVDTASGLNGDTITDFAAGDRIVISDANLALSSFPHGTLEASAAAGGGVQLTFHSQAHNDFNRDGRSNVLWRSDSGELYDWLANASGGFSNNSANFDVNISSEWRVAGSGDFNGDGYSDLLWRQDGTGRTLDWVGNSSGGFASNAANFDINISSEWRVLGTGDFNGDGIDDLLWRQDGTGHMLDWLGNSSGGFTSNAANFDAPNTGTSLRSIGDFNGDGRDDLFWHSGSFVNATFGTSAGGFSGSYQTTVNSGESLHVQDLFS